MFVLYYGKNLAFKLILEQVFHVLGLFFPLISIPNNPFLVLKLCAVYGQFVLVIYIIAEYINVSQKFCCGNIFASVCSYLGVIKIVSKK